MSDVSQILLTQSSARECSVDESGENSAFPHFKFQNELTLVLVNGQCVNLTKIPRTETVTLCCRQCV